MFNNELKQKFSNIKEEIWKEYVKNIHEMYPCPICGSTPKLEICQIPGEDGFVNWYVSIRCSDCGCTMKDINHPYENSIEAQLNSDLLVAKWNNRIKLKDE